MLKDQLTHIIGGLGSLGFEMALGLGAIILLLVGVWVKRMLVSQILFVVVLLSATFLLPVSDDFKLLFADTLVVDVAANLFKMLFGMMAIWIVFFPNASKHTSEFYFLILSVILGSALMLGANHLLVIYLSIELASYASYILTNFNFEKRAYEASMKYLLFGGVSSALALYGASLIYGFTGTLSLSDMHFTGLSSPTLLHVGWLLFIGAMFFKVSIFPFHTWVPATYQIAPTDAVAVLSVVPKIGGFILLHRMVSVIGLADHLWLYWVIIGVGIITILLGTFAAIGQTNLKRLVAYGAIAHSGFLLAAIIIPGETGITAFTWYAIVYALMNLLMFYLISVLEQKQIFSLSDLSGYYKKDVVFGILIVIAVISLIGLPPTAGFTVKFYLFLVIWERFQAVGDVVLLSYLIVAVLSVVVSLFIYLKIPYYYFLKDSTTPQAQKFTWNHKFLATIFAITLLLIFLGPEILNNIAEKIKPLHW